MYVAGMSDTFEEQGESVEAIVKGFEEYGLTPNEARTYVYLAKAGLSKASDLSRALSIHRTEVYRILGELQKKGVVRYTLARPTRFAAVPVEEALNTLAEEARLRVNLMEKDRESLLSRWKALSVETPPQEAEALQVLDRVERAYARGAEMLRQAERRVSIVASELDLVQAYNAGFIDILIESSKRASRMGLELLILTEVTPRIFGFLQKIRAREIRDIRMAPGTFPHFILADETELLHFISGPGRGLGEELGTALWTTCRAIVYSMSHLFNELWPRGAPVEMKGAAPIAQPSPAQQPPPPISPSEAVKTVLERLGAARPEAREKFRLKGASGRVYEFDLAVVRGGAKPVVVDHLLSVPATVSAILEASVKKMDVEGFIAGYFVGVRRPLDPDVRRLADLYKIGVIEL